MPNFVITYTPLPEDEELREYWQVYNNEAYLNDAIEGHVGIFYDNKPLIEMITDFGLPEDCWTITDTPKLASYALATWFITAYWQIMYQHKPTNPKPIDFHEWSMDHCMNAIGMGRYWPSITIWRYIGQYVNIHIEPVYVRNDGYNYMGYDRQPHTILAVRQWIVSSQIDQFVKSVLYQCELRGYTETELHDMYEELIADRNDPKLRLKLIESVNE